MKIHGAFMAAHLRKAIVAVPLLCLMLVVGSSRAMAQGESFTYNFVKGWLQGEGYTILTDKYAYLAPGETEYITQTFYSGSSYKVVAFSDDDDVTDVDLYAYYTNGSEYSKSNTNSSLASLVIAPYTTRTLKLLWKNYASNAPRYKSTVYLIVGYK